MVRFEDPDPAEVHVLGPEQSIGAPGEPVSVHIPDLARQLRVTAIPADVDVVDGALHLVVALAQVTVDGADGVSVSLQRHGQLMTVAATDQTISDMDANANQYATGEGPCVDASVHGHWFHAESFDQETRWPDFTPKAQELGINAILSNPLMANERPVGALNIYSRTAAAFSSKDQELASIFAFEASIILRHTRVDVSDRELSWRLDEALRARRLIAQAQGVMIGAEGISEEDAFTELRGLGNAMASPFTSGRPTSWAPLGVCTRAPQYSPGRRDGRTPQHCLGPGPQGCRALPRGAMAAVLRPGGMSTALQVEAFLYGALQPSAHDYDVVAQAESSAIFLKAVPMRQLEGIRASVRACIRPARTRQSSRALTNALPFHQATGPIPGRAMRCAMVALTGILGLLLTSSGLAAASSHLNLPSTTGGCQTAAPFRWTGDLRTPRRQPIEEPSDRSGVCLHQWSRAISPRY